MTPDHHQFRKARVAVDLSIDEVGHATRCGRATISLLEAGKWPEDADLRRKLVELYEGMGVQFGPEGQVTVLP
jgi:hypothetical protein